MSGGFEARLAELGVTLPDAPAPAANYVPYVMAGDLVFVSGQVSMGENGLIKGKLGAPSGCWRSSRRPAAAIWNGCSASSS
jgi:hypothetical protein